MYFTCILCLFAIVLLVFQYLYNVCYVGSKPYIQHIESSDDVDNGKWNLYTVRIGRKLVKNEGLLDIFCSQKFRSVKTLLSQLGCILKKRKSKLKLKVNGKIYSYHSKKKINVFPQNNIEVISTDFYSHPVINLSNTPHLQHKLASYQYTIKLESTIKGKNFTLISSLPCRSAESILTESADKLKVKKEKLRLQINGASYTAQRLVFPSDMIELIFKGFGGAPGDESRTTKTDDHDDNVSTAEIDIAETPTKKRKQTCMLHKFGLCNQGHDHETTKFTIEEVAEFFKFPTPDQGETSSETLHFCKSHYYEITNAISKCIICGTCKEPKKLRPFPIHQLQLAKDYCLFNQKRLVIKILSKSKICSACRHGVLTHKENEVDQFNVTLFKANKCLKDVSKEIEEKVQKEPCNGKDCNMMSMHKTVLHICATFNMGKAILFASAFDFYVECLSNCHPEESKTPFTKSYVESYLKTTFGDCLLITSVQDNPRIGKLLQWKDNNASDMLHQLLYSEYKKIDLKSELITQEKAILQQIPKKLQIQEKQEESETDTLEKALKILRRKLKDMQEKICNDEKEGKLDITSVDLDRFVNEYSDPLLWNFYVQLTLGDNERKALKKDVFSWNEHVNIPPDRLHKFQSRVFLMCLINYISSSHQTIYPLHVLVADVVSQYTDCSERCISMLNILGCCVSDDTLDRHMSATVDEVLKTGPEKQLTPGSFFVVTVDNWNLRFSKMRVRLNDDKRGFDGTTIQFIEIEKLLRTSDEYTEFERLAKTFGTVQYILVPSKEDHLSFYRSVCRFFYKDLITSQTVGTDHDYINTYTREEQGASTMQVLIKEDLNEKCTDLDKLFNDQFSCFKDWPGNVQSHIDHVLDCSENVSCPEYLSIVRLTGHPLIIFEEENNLLKPIVKITPEVPKSVLPITLLRKGEFYHTMFDITSYEKNLKLQDNIFQPIQQNNTSFKANELYEYDLLLESIQTKSEINESSTAKKSSYHRPSDRCMNKEVQKKGDIIEFSAVKGIECQTRGLTSDDVIKVTESEVHAYNQFKKEVFTYTYCRTTVNQPDECSDGKLIPDLKVFHARQYEPTTEPSNFVYYELNSLITDNKDALLQILADLYTTLEINKRYKYLVVVGDGKVFEVLLKIKDEYGENMNWLLPYIGDWHFLYNTGMHLFKIYGPCGLNELVERNHKGALAARIIAGTVFDKTLAFIFQVWEAMYRRQISFFLDNRENLHTKPHEHIFEDIAKDLALDYNDRKSNNFDEIHEKVHKLNASLEGMHDEFKLFNNMCCDRDENYKFWNDFIHTDCASYIGFYIAMRTGNWELRNACLKSMTEIFQVTTSTFYRKLLPVHLYHLKTFPTAILQHFKNGGWVANINGNNASNVAFDEAHETKINLHLKQAVTGTSVVQFVRTLHYLTYRAIAHKNLFSQLQVKENSKYQAKDSEKYIKESECLVKDYFKALKEKKLFETDCSISHEQERIHLKHLMKGEFAGKLEREDLLNIHKIGSNNLKVFLDCNILGVLHGKPAIQTKFHNFGSTKKEKNDEKSERYFRDQSLALLKKSHNWARSHKTDPGELHALNPLPIGICNYDATPYSAPKSKAVSYFKKNFKECFINGYLPVEHEINAIIVEGMFAINSKPWVTHTKFKHYADNIYQHYVLRYFNKFQQDVKEVHIVFDCQDSSIITPKYFERIKRDKANKASPTIEEISDETHMPKSWDRFINNRANKKKFIEYLCTYLLKKGTALPKGKELIVSGGFAENGLVKRASDNEITEMKDLRNNHLEGDTLVFLHAIHSKQKNIMIYSRDSDVFFIAFSIAEKYPEKRITLMLNDYTGNQEYFDLFKFCEVVKENVHLSELVRSQILSTLQALFICTGCDYISAFKRHAKLGFLKTFFKHATFICGENNGLDGTLSNLADGSDGGLMSFYRLVSCEYFTSVKRAFSTDVKDAEDLFRKYCTEGNIINDHEECLNRIRKATFVGNINEEEFLISTNALKFHWSRSSYVANVWKQADQCFIQYPDLTEYGWKTDNDKLTVVWDTEKSQKELELLYILLCKGCKCETKNEARLCAGNCRCKKSGISCHQGCRCSNQHENKRCKNAPQDPSLDAIKQQIREKLENDQDQLEDSSQSNVIPHQDFDLEVDSSDDESLILDENILQFLYEDIDNDFDEDESYREMYDAILE